LPQRSIRFRINSDGRVEETVEGVAGLACEALTERIEASLGVVQQRYITTENASVVMQLTGVTEVHHYG